MGNNPTYFLVDSSVLPDVFTKVIEVKKILSTGRIKTVNEAVRGWPEQKRIL